MNGTEAAQLVMQNHEVWPYFEFQEIPATEALEVVSGRVQVFVYLKCRRDGASHSDSVSAAVSRQGIVSEIVSEIKEATARQEAIYLLWSSRV